MDRIRQHHCPCSVLSRVSAHGFPVEARKGSDTPDPLAHCCFEAPAESGRGKYDRITGEQSIPDHTYRAVGSWDWDLAARSLRINLSGRELRVFAGPEGLACTEPWDRFVHPDDIPLLRRALADLVDERRQGFGIGIRVQYAGSSWQQVLVTGSAGPAGGTGLPVWIGGAIFDASPYVMTCPGDTESRNRLLLGTLQHDLRNWLSAIIGYWEVLQERLPEDPSMKSCAARMELSIDGLSNKVDYINEILDAAKCVPVWQHLAGTFEAAAAGVLPETVCLNLADGLPEIYADTLLSSVCANLLDNAIRHGGEVTAISVSMRMEEDAAIVVVEDDGVGIPSTLKDRIFDPGYGRHTGYGLYFIRAILGRTSLSIRECGEEGSGARFEIRIPPGFFRPADPKAP